MPAQTWDIRSQAAAFDYAYCIDSGLLYEMQVSFRIIAEPAAPLSAGSKEHRCNVEGAARRVVPSAVFAIAVGDAGAYNLAVHLPP